MEKTNRQEGENHVNDCKVKQRERSEGKGRRKAENMVEGSEIVLLTLQEEAVREGGRREGQEREGGGIEENGKRVFQSVLGRLAENSGHVGPCETF